MLEGGDDDTPRPPPLPLPAAFHPPPPTPPAPPASRAPPVPPAPPVPDNSVSLICPRGCSHSPEQQIGRSSGSFNRNSTEGEDSREESNDEEAASPRLVVFMDEAKGEGDRVEGDLRLGVPPVSPVGEEDVEEGGEEEDEEEEEGDALL